MKKNIKRFTAGIMLAACVVSTSVTAAQASTATDELAAVKQQILALDERKEIAHSMAENARALGLSEDSETILIAKQHWHEADDSQTPLLEKKASLEEAVKSEQNTGSYVGNFKLTFYTPSPAENGGYNVTATGKSLSGGTWRYIAVDPSVIPLGSTVYIEGLGTFTAEDTGGAIRGNRIDVLVNYGEADSLGVQYRNVYIR